VKDERPRRHWREPFTEHDWLQFNCMLIFAICLVGLVVLLGACAPLAAANRPDICSYVRGAVSAGDFPLDIAALQYPECHAVARR
jgi:hypothetical protein